MTTDDIYNKALDAIKSLSDKMKLSANIESVKLTKADLEILKLVPKSILDVIDKELAKYQTSSSIDVRKQYIYKSVAILFSNINEIMTSIRDGYNTGKQLYA